MFRNPQYHTTSQRILFSPIYKTCSFFWKYGGIYLKYIWILHFCYIFNKVARFHARFLRFNWFWKHCFEDRTRWSSLAYTDTKHRTRYSKRFHSTTCLYFSARDIIINMRKFRELINHNIKRFSLCSSITLSEKLCGSILFTTLTNRHTCVVEARRYFYFYIQR